MPLTRDQILRPRKTFTKTIPAPELGDGETLTVRRLKASEFLELSAKAKTAPEAAYIHWIIATVVDDQGSPIFGDDDVASISGLDITLIERLSNAAQEINLAKTGDVLDPKP